MAITLRRQLDDDEKAYILQVHGRKCFATDHPIPADEVPQFDHLHAFAEGGVTELSNIAPMCEVHNKQKGTLPLADFRIKLRLQQFFQQGDRLTLRDLLGHLQAHGDIAAYGRPVVVHEADGHLVIETQAGQSRHALYQCPTTGWKYLYATLPVEVLDSDDEKDPRLSLQPRYLIFEVTIQPVEGWG